MEQFRSRDGEEDTAVKGVTAKEQRSGVFLRRKSKRDVLFWSVDGKEEGGLWSLVKTVTGINGDVEFWSSGGTDRNTEFSGRNEDGG